MKFKQRALALLLSMVMVLTFMPALAFAEDGGSDISFSRDISYDVETDWLLEFQSGDSVTLAGYDGVFNYVPEEDAFVMTDGDDEIYLYYDFDYEDMSYCFFVGSREDPAYTCTVPQSDFTSANHVQGIAFSPNTVTIEKSDITVTDAYGTYLNIYKRGADELFFAQGDTVSVTRDNGKSATYTYKQVTDTYEDETDSYYVFVNNNNEDDRIWLGIDYTNPTTPFVDGLNTNFLTVDYYGATAYVSVYLDSPEQRAKVAAAAAEAARQGTLDPSIPKIKSVKKSKVKKTSITVKWKKLTKKQLKKSKAKNIEIWVCPNTDFKQIDTKRYTVKAKKSSRVCKGLQKNTTYYVKVRAIRGDGTVGPWSAQKKIKTKKK